MKVHLGIILATILISCFSASNAKAQPGPFDGKVFKGRIAYSADGNHNDEDDWAASPVALAIFAEFGVKGQVVHFDYNSILTDTDRKWEKKHETGVLGAARRYGYDESIFHNSQKDREAAIASIARAINASSAENPLYFIIAGPLVVPYLGIQRASPEKRKFVYCISHSRWNDGFDIDYTHSHNKRDVIPLGVQWVQIRDQNRFLSTSPFGRPARPEEWDPWRWMRNSKDGKVQFLWRRLRVSERADCSDAGMAYFLMSGDEESEIPKLRKLLEDKVVPKPIDPRTYIRIEAENFLELENYKLDYRNDRNVSHRISMQLEVGGVGRIRTRVRQPYMALRGRYDVVVRYFDGKSGHGKLSLHVNGERQGPSWEATADDNNWKTHTVPSVNISLDDEIAVTVQGRAGEDGRLDYVQLNYRDSSP